MAYCAKAKARLVPLHTDLLSHVDSDSDAASAPSPETTPVSIDLAYGRVCYVVEAGAALSHYELIQYGDLTRASMSPEQLHESALKRLTEYANEHLELLEHQGGLYELSVGNDFEASLLLITSLWTSVLPTYVGQTPLAAVTGLGRLFIGSETHTSALLDVFEQTRESDEPRHFDGIIQFSNNEWTPLR